MIIVKPMDTDYFLEMDHEDVKVIFTFRQLSYTQKADIAQRTTSITQGKVVQDFSLNSFLTVKYALKNVEGLHCMIKGEEKEYKLKMDKDGCVSDASLDEIFNTPFSDRLTYSVKHLTSGVPTEITNPLTGGKLEGVEIVTQKGGLEKK